MNLERYRALNYIGFRKITKKFLKALRNRGPSGMTQSEREGQVVVKDSEFTFMSKLAKEYFMQVDLDWMLL